MISPTLFDRRRQRAFDDKAARKLALLSPSAVPDFLLRYAADEIVSRLAVISRTFARAADIGARHGMMAQMLKAWKPDIEIVSLTSSLPLARLCPSPALVADEEVLPLGAERFDLITSVLAYHLVNDLPGALIQARRALKPDGLFMAAVLGGDSLIELRQATMQAETETMGGASPRVFPTMEMRDAGGLLQRAGFALPVTDAEQLRVTYASPLALMRELKAMGMSNALFARRKSFLRRDTLARACDIYAERFPAPNGRVSATFELFYLSGWAPHASQQKPLAPGSARHRLADALNTQELAAGDKAGFKNESD